MNRTPRVLVICTANRCRSQMAEGWPRHFAGDRLIVRSAGTRPGGLHPRAVATMADHNVDIGGQTSDPLSRYGEDRFDLVVTVCDRAAAACPTFPHAQRVEHRPFDDPDRPELSDDEQGALFQRVCGEIRDWARETVTALTGT